tara:strand:- start:13813 stop:14580 length:768 start_codon:yes stop_codon:yes gene_type:complete
MNKKINRPPVLHNTTCFAIDNTHRIENTIKSLIHCKNVAKFSEVKLVTTKALCSKYKDALSHHEIVAEEQVAPLTNIDEYNFYILYNLHNHIETNHVLIVQDHAFIINPQAWREEFLDYDYIGAPWPLSETTYITPFNERARVGNGGFSLRSQKLLTVPNYTPIPFHVSERRDFYQMFGQTNTNEDGNICVHNKHLFEKAGCKFAPIEVARYFSYENPVPENSGILPFGFHKKLPTVKPCTPEVENNRYYQHSKH